MSKESFLFSEGGDRENLKKKNIFISVHTGCQLTCSQGQKGKKQKAVDRRNRITSTI